LFLKEKEFKDKNLIRRMKKGRVINKTIFGVIGVLLTLFGVISAIPILLNKQSLISLPLAAISVIVGILLIAWALN
jgi:protein-S-isoprenylcysteine O-methyltransferase Ste14